MPLDRQRLLEVAKEQNGVSPISETDISPVEREIGFAIPLPLRRFYSEISGGGFGPGCGFYGLLNGTETFPDETVVYLYSVFRKGDPDDSAFLWPYMLLPILDWGCAIRSCVDCSTPSLPIIRFDPNLPNEDQFQSENFHFEEWLQAWLDGYDHF